MYQKEIDILFQNAERDLAVDVAPIDTSNFQALKDTLQQVAEKSMGITLESDDTNFFESGCDSMKAAVLAATLRQSLQHLAIGNDRFSTRLVYEYPSLSQLAHIIYQISRDPRNVVNYRNEHNQQTLTDLVNSSTIESKFTPPSDITQHEYVVLLTGSTGSLGSYLLHECIINPTITSVFCLNRHQDAESRQIQVNQSRGLTTDFGQVAFITADLSKDRLGLDDVTYERMLSEVSVIIRKQEELLPKVARIWTLTPQQTANGESTSIYR